MVGGLGTRLKQVHAFRAEQFSPDSSDSKQPFPITPFARSFRAGIGSSLSIRPGLPPFPRLAAAEQRGALRPGQSSGTSGYY